MRGSRSAKLVLVQACLWAIILAACASDSESPDGGEPIRIGILAPRTGFAADLGRNAVLGARLALSEFGSEVDGRPVELVIEDDVCTPENAVNAANRLLDQVVAVVGPQCSAAAAAAGVELSRAEIPYVIGGFDPTLTERGDTYIFRATPSDRFVLAVLIRQLEEEGVADSVALVRDSSGYGSSSGDAFVQELEAAGHPAPVVDAVFDLEATDLTGQVQAIQGEPASSIVVISFQGQTGLFVKQARQLGVELPVFQIYAEPAMSTPAGDFVDGVWFAARYSPDNPETQEFTDSFVAALDSEPSEVSSVNAYAGMLAILDALEREGADARGEQLRDAIRATSIDSLVGHISFDENGDLQEPLVYVGVYEGQAPVFEGVVRPDDLS